jgi:hypothetical protein
LQGTPKATPLKRNVRRHKAQLPSVEERSGFVMDSMTKPVKVNSLEFEGIKNEANMKCDIIGLLHAAMIALNEGDELVGQVRHGVKNLIDNLVELKERLTQGDNEVIDEFLELYCLTPNNGLNTTKEGGA